MRVREKVRFGNKNENNRHEKMVCELYISECTGTLLTVQVSSATTP